MRLFAYLVYTYAVPDAYKLIPNGFLVPRAVHNRLVRIDLSGD
jgi:hypothetical protein